MSENMLSSSWCSTVTGTLNQPFSPIFSPYHFRVISFLVLHHMFLGVFIIIIIFIIIAISTLMGDYQGREVPRVTQSASSSSQG
jgi:hypothetical protein